MDTKLCWHYTTVEKLIKIIQCGGVLLTEDYTSSRIDGLRGAVWFTTSEVFEPTAYKGIIENGVRRLCTLDEMRKYCGGLVRIGVRMDSPFLMDWEAWKKTCTIGDYCIRGLEKAAIDMGSDVKNFRASLGSVHHNDWIAVEIDRDGQGWKKYHKI